MAFLAIARCRQPVDRQTQIRQYVVIDDIVEEHTIRIEGVLLQNNAVIKGFVVANGSVLGVKTGLTLEGLDNNRCEPTHNLKHR